MPAMVSYTFATVDPVESPDLPSVKVLSIEETTKHARRFSTSIFADWTKLNAILKRFEDTIQKRWIKKSTKQRREILLKAWPEIIKAQTHCPDFAALRRPIRTAQPCLEYYASFLWPYINLEDLLDPTNLLHFMHSRGRNWPDLFVSADLHAAHLGSPKPPLKEGPFDMLLNGGRSPSRYGVVFATRTFIKNAPTRSVNGVNVGRTLPALDGQHRSIIIHHPSLGLLVLEIQKEIYSFLLSCAKTILHDIHPAQYFLAPHRKTPSVPESVTKDWSCLTTHMKQMPYRTPQNMDLNRLKILVQAQRTAAEDHLWMLREDPGYFIESVKDMREHCTYGRDKSSPKAIWHKLAAVTLVDAFTWFMRWNHVSKLLDDLPPMDVQLRQANKNALRLPLRAERIWVQLLAMVEEMITMPLMRLRDGYPHSPRMRHRYSLRFEDGAYYVERLGEVYPYSEHRVISFFDALCHPDRRDLHGLRRLVHEGQYMFEEDPGASQLVDSWILCQFSELATLSELRDRIYGLYPWSSGWSLAGVPNSLEVKNKMKEFWDSDEKVRAAIGNAGLSGTFIFLGDPLRDWDYPVAKSKTEKNVEQMRTAEERLDVLWDDLEHTCHVLGNVCLFEIIAECFAEKRTLYRTPAWVVPTPQPAKKQPALADVNPNITRLPRDAPATPAKVTVPLKEKIKTRGTPTAREPKKFTHASSLPVSYEEAPNGPTSRQIKVPKRAYKTLSALFPATGADNHQRREVEWGELLQALDAIGLSPEKLYGSVWLFKPKEKADCLVEMDRSIQFHEPKEVRHGSKIPATMVRVFGRRLKHAFGWENGMFISE